MKLNGIKPPIGTLLRGMEPLVVSEHTETGVRLRLAQSPDFMAANMREPREVHSVYEHHLIPQRWSVFGPIRAMGVPNAG